MSNNRVESERAYSWAETAVCRRLLAVAAAAVVLIGVADVVVVVVVVVIVVAVVVVLVLVLVLALLLSVVVMLMLMMMLIAPGDLRLRTLRPMDCFSSSTDVSDAGLNCQHGSDSRRERGNLKPQTTIVMHAPEAAGLNLAVAYPHPLGPSEHDLCHRAARK